MKMYRVLSHEGRVTIPWDMRQIVGFRPGSIVSFHLVDDRSILVRKEALSAPEGKPYEIPGHCSLLEFLEGLTEKQRYDALVHLSVLWAESHDGKSQGGKI